MADDQSTGPGHDSPSSPTRRDFLRRGLATAAGAFAASSLFRSAEQLLAQDAAQAAAKPGPTSAAAKSPAPAPAAPVAAGDAPKSRVILITHPEALIKDYDANRPVIEKMIERAVRELTGAENERKAWQQVAFAGQRVSMKTTRAGGPQLRTHDEIPAYLARRLADVAEVDPKRIRAWDREDLQGDEFDLVGPFVLPTRKQETFLRAALVRDGAAIINLPVLKMHTGTGASIALKNHFGSINNPAAFHGWDKGDMAKSIAELNNLDPIKKHTRLVICDATRPLYRDGPLDKPDFRWTFNGLIVGVDPVAVESVGLDILEQKRADIKGQPWPATDGRKVVEWAQEIGVGQAAPARIDLVTIKLD